MNRILFYLICILASVVSAIVLIPIAVLITQDRTTGIGYGIPIGISIAICSVNYFLLKKKFLESIMFTLLFAAIFALTLFLSMKLYCSIITCVIDMILALELSFVFMKLIKKKERT